MPKERNKADGYREKAYEGDTKAMNRSTSGRLLPARLRRFARRRTGRKNLGVCYERGTGVKVNLEIAFEWYIKAAAKGGDAQAQFATGWFLMTGTGVPKDERKGLKWIHKATFQGFQPAIDYCKEHGYKWY